MIAGTEVFLHEILRISTHKLRIPFFVFVPKFIAATLCRTPAASRKLENNQEKFAARLNIILIFYLLELYY